MNEMNCTRIHIILLNNYLLKMLCGQKCVFVKFSKLKFMIDFIVNFITNIYDKI